MTGLTEFPDTKSKVNTYLRLQVRPLGLLGAVRVAGIHARHEEPGLRPVGMRLDELGDLTSEIYTPE